MTDKLFTLAGTSVLKGVKTMRFATGKVNVRTGVLKRNGHTDIALFDLPKPMSKLDAAAWLQDEKDIKDAVLPAGRTTKEAPTTAERAAEIAAAKKAERSQKAKDKRAKARAEKAKQAEGQTATA